MIENTSRTTPVRLSSFPGSFKNNANRIRGKLFTIKFNSFIGHADIETDAAIQDIINGNLWTGLGQSGIDDQRAVGPGAKAEESVGDDRWQKGAFVKLVIDAEPAAGAAALQSASSFSTFVIFSVSSFRMHFFFPGKDFH